jgi:hypothetical protein
MPQRKEQAPGKRKLHELRSKAESSGDSEIETSNDLICGPAQQPVARSALAVLPRSPGMNSLDPFGTLGIHTDVANTFFLLHHCKLRPSKQ